MSSILILGSEGVIGTPLTAELEKRGHFIQRVGVAHSNKKNYIRCDVSEYRQLERLFTAKFDFVFNLAAEFGRKNGEEYYEQLWKTNVIGLKHLLKLQETHKFRLIQFSSSEIYGEPVIPEGAYLDEQMSDRMPLKQNNDYAISKWVNEMQIRNSMITAGTESLVVRLFNAYGPGEYYTPYRSVVSQFIYNALMQKPYDVYLGYRRVFMYIDDLIPTLANTVDRFRPQTYNIGGREFVDVKRVSDMILKQLNLDDTLVNYLPMDRHNIKAKRPDISLAEKYLGHNPSTLLTEGIPKTIEWMRHVYQR